MDDKSAEKRYVVKLLILKKWKLWQRQEKKK